jgi:hypothetical protein
MALTPEESAAAQSAVRAAADCISFLMRRQDYIARRLARGDARAINNLNEIAVHLQGAVSSIKYARRRERLEQRRAAAKAAEVAASQEQPDCPALDFLTTIT